ncbi:hypothetical protein [Fusobacterium varium]|uniref:hypothetical protein n=1 Tax=Fusobacterium varium TaxID=856 RepID=UPI000BBA5096|nr:hypothetical protein [uncultured Fusobacterium sp.]BBA51158.1 hypothetical protein FV113G1_15070 [Fusobacterium varium]
MLLHVKKSLNGYKIENDEGVVIDCIKSKKFMSPAQLILKDNSIVYETDIITENGKNAYIIKNKTDETIAAAELKFEEEKKNSIVHSPKVEYMIINTPYGKWRAVQENDLSISFIFENKVIGKISSFFSYHSQEISFSENYPVEFWSALYILSRYMVHENDVITV